jgi:tRNA A-37 threonylcarbamoyl transferase component Bud32
LITNPIHSQNIDHFEPVHGISPKIQKSNEKNDKLLIFPIKSIFKTNEIICRIKKQENSPTFSNGSMITKDDDYDIVSMLNQLDVEDNLSSSHLEHSIPNLNLTNKSISSLFEEEDVCYQGEVFKLTKTSKMKKYYLVLTGKEIYYYKNESKEVLKGMHNLSGAFFFLEDSAKVINNKTYYSFVIRLCCSNKTFYTLCKETAEKFVENLKKALGDKDIQKHYEFVKEVGRGSFGKVFKAINKSTNEKVAIKVLRKDILSERDLKSIRWEIDIMRTCFHPNIIRFIDYFETCSTIYIVMEYAPGGDLHEYVNNKELMTEIEAKKIMKQLANGVKYLHKMGIVHRDLKPENILISNKANLEIKIMDFGLSKIMSVNEKSSDGVGTVNYVAPEVLLREPYNFKVDVWSMGIILYFLLTKYLPFEDTENREENIITLTLQTETEFPKQLWAGRTKSCIKLIESCLVKDPKKRIGIDLLIVSNWLTC